MSAEGRARIDLRDLQGALTTARDRVESLHGDYETAKTKAAEAEHAWKRHAAAVAVAIADKGDRTSEDVRKARAIDQRPDLHERYLLTAARADIVHQGIISARADLDAIRTLIASERTLLG